MSSTPLPLRRFFRYQEDLLWWATESDGALGRRSIQGSIEARLEGRTGVRQEIDILENPQEAYEYIINRIGHKASERLHIIEEAWKRVGAQDKMVLAAIYWTPLQLGLEAFGPLANVVPLTQTAHYRYEASNTKMTFGEWLTRLSSRRVGVLQKGGKRNKPKARPNEIEHVIVINHEIEIMSETALNHYAMIRLGLDG